MENSYLWGRVVDAIVSRGHTNTAGVWETRLPEESAPPRANLLIYVCFLHKLNSPGGVECETDYCGQQFRKIHV